jgi:lipid-binding SYLF domain-containing protein
MQSTRTMRLTFAAALAATVLGAAGGAFAKEEQLVSEARQTIAQYKQIDPALGPFFEHAAGYAVFPNIGKGGLVVGGAHGTGVLFEGGVPTGKVTMSQVTVGAQAGGQAFSEVIVFETPSALAEFRSGKFAFSSEASAVVLNQGAAAVARYQHGVAVFTSMKGGLMVAATVGGQKFSYEPFARR